MEKENTDLVIKIIDKIQMVKNTQIYKERIVMSE